MINFRFEQYGVGALTQAHNSMDMNNHLEFVEIHNNGKDHWMFYGAGRVDDERAVFQTNGSTLNFATLGFFPRISINDKRTVVATFRGGADPLRYLYCQAGRYENGVVKWFANTQKTFCSTPEDIFDTAINDTHFLVAYTYKDLFHDGNHIRTYIKLGKIDAGTGKLDWVGDAWNSAGRGTLPSISLNGSGSVVVLAKSTDQPRRLYYKIGHIDGNEVVWDSGETFIARIDADIGSVTIALNDSNEVVLAYVANRQSFYMEGVLQHDRKSIRFVSDPTSFPVGNHGGVNVLVAASCGGGSALMAANDGTLVEGIYAGVGSMNRNWIGTNMNLYGKRRLREFTLPGSHDAAMSRSVACTVGAATCNTQTQNIDIAHQLENGIRYFDLRPIRRRDGGVTLGHFSGHMFGFSGCEGETLEAVLDAVARFLASTQREIVILAFSHFQDHALGRENEFPPQIFDQFLATIRNSLGPFLLTVHSPINLADQTLADLTAKGNVVLPIIDCQNTLPALDPAIYPYRPRRNNEAPLPDRRVLSIFDDFSESNDVATMAATQFERFRNSTNRANSDLYLFSWTLTQSAFQASTCPRAASILDLAAEANAALPGNIRNAVADKRFTSSQKPNILYVDACGSAVTDLCILLNNL